MGDDDFEKRLVKPEDWDKMANFTEEDQAEMEKQIMADLDSIRKEIAASKAEKKKGKVEKKTSGTISGNENTAAAEKS